MNVFIFIGVLFLLEVVYKILKEMSKSRIGRIQFAIVIFLVLSSVFLVAFERLLSLILGGEAAGLGSSLLNWLGFKITPVLIIVSDIVFDCLLSLILIIFLKQFLNRMSFLNLSIQGDELVYSFNDKYFIRVGIDLFKNGIVLFLFSTVMTRLVFFNWLIYKNMFTEIIVIVLVVLFVNLLLMMYLYFLKMRKALEKFCIDLIFWDVQFFSCVHSIIERLIQDGKLILKIEDVDKGVRLFYDLGVFYSAAVDFDELIEKGYWLEIKKDLLERYQSMLKN